jgi:sulfate adenylyltransferase
MAAIRLAPDEFFDNAFFCTACGQMATAKTCPHPASDRVEFSGTVVRKLLAAGQPLPAEYRRPQVAELLIEAYAASPSLAAVGDGMGRASA